MEADLMFLCHGDVYLTTGLLDPRLSLAGSFQGPRMISEECGGVSRMQQRVVMQARRAIGWLNLASEF